MEALILARHAESVFNHSALLNGDSSVPGGLTEVGRDQAVQLGRLLADQPIDLCVTTEFERTRQTADLAFEGRAVPRLVMRELNDPPNGEFELRPTAELASWRARHGPHAPIPGVGRTERELVASMLPGLALLAARREGIVVAILHGWFVGWVLGAAGNPSAVPAHATPHHIAGDDLDRALCELRQDPYRFC